MSKTKYEVQIYEHVATSIYDSEEEADDVAEYEERVNGNFCKIWPIEVEDDYDYEEDEYLPEDDTDSEDSKVPDDWFHDVKREDGD